MVVLINTTCSRVLHQASSLWCVSPVLVLFLPGQADQYLPHQHLLLMMAVQDVALGETPVAQQSTWEQG